MLRYDVDLLASLGEIEAFKRDVRRSQSRYVKVLLGHEIVARLSFAASRRLATAGFRGLAFARARRPRTCLISPFQLRGKADLRVGAASSRPDCPSSTRRSARSRQGGVRIDGQRSRDRTLGFLTPVPTSPGGQAPVGRVTLP